MVAGAGGVAVHVLLEGVPQPCPWTRSGRGQRRASLNPSAKVCAAAELCGACGPITINGGTFESSVGHHQAVRDGRILEYNSLECPTRIVARWLSFANGVALSQDEKTLFVSETGRYRAGKIATDASNVDVAQPSPQATVLLDQLPRYRPGMD